MVATIQAFLDARANALPRIAKQRREGKKKKLESQDEYSFGIDFSTVDLIALGGEAASIDPVQQKEEDFATVNPTRSAAMLMKDHHHYHISQDL